MPSYGSRDTRRGWHGIAVLSISLWLAAPVVNIAVSAPTISRRADYSIRGVTAGPINNALVERWLLLFQAQRLAEITLVIGTAGTLAADKLGFAHYLAQRLEIGGDLVTAPLTQGFTAHNDYLYDSMGVL